MAEAVLTRLMSRHAVVGAGCALTNIGIVHVGTAWIGWPYWWAALTTCAVTIPVSYVLHRRFSFQITGDPSLREFGRYVGQQLLQFSAGLLLLSVGVESGGLTPTQSMALATALLWLLAFLVQWRWVFAASSRTKRS